MPFISHLSVEDYGTFQKRITDLPSAKAFIDMLARNGLMFHFDDDVFTIIWGEEATGGANPTAVDLLRLDRRRNELYDPDLNLDWSNDGGCPIGYALVALAEAERNMPKWPAKK